MYVFLVLIASLITMAVIVAVRRMKYAGNVNEHHKVIPCFLLSDVALMVLDIAAGGNVAVRLLSDVSWAVLPMLVLHMSLCPDERRERTAVMCMIPAALPALHHVLLLFNVIPPLPGWVFLSSASSAAAAVVMFYVCLLWKRMSDMRAVMHSGTVWSFVCLGVDSVYCMSAAAIVMLCALLSMAFGDCDGLHVYAALVLLWLELMALCLRSIMDSEFVMRQKREMMIVESMKVSQMEFSNVSSKMDEIYKDIYERVVLHFEMEKPFLNGNLSINDVVKVVYSNKVYISKAICHYTGRNFCQFVNYYRVIYSMDVFRKQPGLKVAELASLSGFNCTVSFTTAFRLFMNETPSEWCRKERTKLLKTKN